MAADDPLSLIDGPIFPSELGTTLVELAEQIYTTGISSGPVVLPRRFQELGEYYPPAERKLNIFANAVNKVTAPDTITTFAASSDEVRLTSAVNTMIKQANGHGQRHQTIGSVIVGNLSFIPDGINPQTVGGVVVTMSPVSPAFSGIVTITGTDAAKFQLSNAGVLPCVLQAKSTTGSGSFSIQLVATQSGIRNSPKSSGLLTITGTPPQIVFSLNLDNTTWLPNGATDVAVGNVAAVMSPAYPLSTATITLGGADAASFQLTNSGALPCQVEAKAATIAGTYHITLIATQAGIVNSPFSQPISLVGSDQAFVSLGIDNVAWTVTGSVVTVGNVAVVLAPAFPPATATITLGGADAASFQLTNGGVLPCIVEAKAATTVGSYSITLTATQSGISNSPFTSSPMTLVGSTSVSITNFQVQEQSGNAQTNMPVTFGLPIAPGVLPSGTFVQVLDGATVLPAQVDLQSSDLAGANVRMMRVTAILGSISASGSKGLTIKSAAGSAPTGTAIVASDITGLVSSTFEPALVTVTIGGTTYTASAKAALAASSSWDITTSQNFGTVVSGPFSTMFLCSAPLVTGGTPHNYLRAWFHVYAFKADSGAVTAQGGGNPILSVLTDVVLENGYAQTHTTTAADIYYGCQIQSSTSLTNATLTLANNSVLADGSGGAVNWTESSTAAGTLTLGSASMGMQTLSRGTGTWTANDNGRVLTAGAGIGQITSVTSGGTSATLRIVADFAGTSLTSGNYVMHGVGHAYAGRWRQRVVVGNAVATAESTTQVVLPWSGSGTRNPMTYLSASKMVPNYGTTPTHVNTGLFYDPATVGARPFATMGDQNSNLRAAFGSPGDAPSSQMGLITAGEVAGTILCDTLGQYLLFKNSIAKAWYPWHVRDTGTGLLPVITGTDWSWDGRWGTTIAGPSWPNGGGSHGPSTTIPAPPTGDLDAAHAPGGPYPAYLLTGDFFWLEEMQFAGWFFAWASSSPGDAGSGINRNKWFDIDQVRGKAWGARSLYQMAAVTPDSTTFLGIPKATMNTYVANCFAGIVATTVDNSTDYGVGGPRWLPDADAHSVSSRNSGFCVHALENAREMGYLDANGSAFADWWEPGFIPPGGVNLTDIAPDWYQNMSTCSPLATLTSLTPYALTWANFYQINAISHMNQRGMNLSLNKTSGTDIIATISGTNIFNGDKSWYIGGIIGEHPTFGPFGQIVSFGAGSPPATVILTTSFSAYVGEGGATLTGSPYSTTTLTNPYVPNPSPSDAGPSGTIIAPGFFENNAMIFTGLCAFYQDNGVANALTAMNYYIAEAGGVSGGYMPTSGTNGYWKYYFVPR